MQHEFTKEELHEIEKLTDMMAGELTKYKAEVFKNLHQYLTNDQKQEMIDDTMKSYDLLRSISAKANAMQMQEEE